MKCCLSFCSAEGKNGDFRQETEEFERALAEVSRNEKAALYKLTGADAAYMSETDEGDELTKQIAGTPGLFRPFLSSFPLKGSLVYKIGCKTLENENARVLFSSSTSGRFESQWLRI